MITIMCRKLVLWQEAVCRRAPSLTVTAGVKVGESPAGCIAGTQEGYMRVWVAIVAAVLAGGSATFAVAQHRQHHDASVPPARNDREFVRFPPALVEHTLANMRDHLQALHEIQLHLGMGHTDIAANIAEKRLGMSSLGLHSAAEVSKYMPQGMQDAGTAMHRAASRVFNYRTGSGCYRRSKARAYGTCGNIGSVRGLSRGVQAKIACKIRARASRTRPAVGRRDRGRPRLRIGVPM